MYISFKWFMSVFRSTLAYKSRCGIKKHKNIAFSEAYSRMTVQQGCVVIIFCLSDIEQSSQWRQTEGGACGGCLREEISLCRDQQHPGTWLCLRQQQKSEGFVYLVCGLWIFQQYPISDVISMLKEFGTVECFNCRDSMSARGGSYANSSLCL